jgi:hypothetical protein
LATNTSKEAMRHNIKLITAPDIIFDQALTVVVIAPDADLKMRLEEYLKNSDQDINVYMHTTSDIKWLLTVSKMADYVLVNIDNCDIYTSHFLAYILSLPNTYYKCEQTSVPWELLSQRRFYDFPTLTEETNERP